MPSLDNLKNVVGVFSSGIIAFGPTMKFQLFFALAQMFNLPSWDWYFPTERNKVPFGARDVMNNVIRDPENAIEFMSLTSQTYQLYQQNNCPVPSPWWSFNDRHQMFNILVLAFADSFSLNIWLGRKAFDNDWSVWLNGFSMNRTDKFISMIAADILKMYAAHLYLSKKVFDASSNFKLLVDQAFDASSNLKLIAKSHVTFL